MRLSQSFTNRSISFGEDSAAMAITIIITQGGLIAVTILVMVNIIIIINHVGMKKKDI